MDVSFGLLSRRGSYTVLINHRKLLGMSSHTALKKGSDAVVNTVTQRYDLHTDSGCRHTQPEIKTAVE